MNLFRVGYLYRASSRRTYISNLEMKFLSVFSNTVAQYRREISNHVSITRLKRIIFRRPLVLRWGFRHNKSTSSSFFTLNGQPST